MDYFVYKTKKEKESIIEDMKRIKEFIYGDQDISCVDGSIELIPYERIKQDRNLVNHLKVANWEICDIDDDWYFKCYDERKPAAIKYYIETIMTHMMFNVSGDGYKGTLKIFHEYIYSRLISEYIGKNKEPGINETLGHLGLLAFSNGTNPELNNDLVVTALYNRDQLERVYEIVMGKGSYQVLNELVNTYCSHLNKGASIGPDVLDNDFKALVDLLKEYFYKKLDTLDLFDDEKQLMINNFEEQYKLLIEKYKRDNARIKRPKPY